MRCRRVVAARDRRHAKRRFGRPPRAPQGQAVSFSLPLQGVVCPEGLVGAPDAQACGLHRTQFSPPHSLHRPVPEGPAGGASPPPPPRGITSKPAPPHPTPPHPPPPPAPAPPRREPQETPPPHPPPPR